ncbi:hypothetical protein J1N35_000860 [Gossypium stocksii]|uniref:Uncharacterized protein n=1 Tax=Gossypium stocksii TaxID=47602 RepID=A0A9D4AKI2_9ROSI|nr:hypothetical protein J1N35_000860 [Gossypium stocksii]
MFFCLEIACEGPYKPLSGSSLVDVSITLREAVDMEDEDCQKTHHVRFIGMPKNLVSMFYEIVLRNFANANGERSLNKYQESSVWMEKALRESHWLVIRCFIVLKKWEPDMGVQDIDFSKVAF